MISVVNRHRLEACATFRFTSDQRNGLKKKGSEMIAPPDGFVWLELVFI
jgi:hypothetical protein